jgi:GNAT superfamily N-acetyltransferase
VTRATASLLERYDREQRINANDPGLRREALAHVVRYIDLVGQSSVVLYSRLDAGSIDGAIAEQIAYFRGLGHEFEWKAFAHDRPADLVDRLRQHGFVIDEPEAIVVLDLEAAPARLFGPTPAVKRVLDPDAAPERIRWEMVNAPDRVSVYVAEVDGRRAAHGWARFPSNSAFASMWGGATVPELRNRGLYSQLVSARVQEARQRGYRYVTVDARAMSRPILERRGFRVLTYATACVLPLSG